MCERKTMGEREARPRPWYRRSRAGIVLAVWGALVLAPGAAGAAQLSSLQAPAPATDAAVTTVPVQPACLTPAQPLPGGPTERPFVYVPHVSDPYLHSSTHLQGTPSTVKWAAGLIHRPAVSTWFNDMTSALVVNNPHPTLTTTVNIDYFDHLGVLVGSSGPVTIQPEGFHAEAATPLASSRGFGSARVTVQSGPKIVGAVLWHLQRLFDGSGFEVLDPDHNGSGTGPGAASMQQLQVVQSATKLEWGPLPVSSISSVDFFNGAQPILTVLNPNNQTVRVRIELGIHNRAGGSTSQVVWRTVDLPPFGSLADVLGAHLTDLGTNDTKGLWNQLFARYQSFAAQNLAGDADYTVYVISETGLPILGDMVVTDIWGGATPLDRASAEAEEQGSEEPEPVPSDNLVLGDRFRMASTMLAPTPTWRLVNPDFTFDFTPNNPVQDILQTLMLVSNVGSTDAGPISIRYFDTDGTQIASASVASLLPNQTLRIEPGVLNYPSTTHVPFGWVRIQACQPTAQLVGWTVREVRDAGVFPNEYQKAFGELLVGNGGQEPGDSFASGDGDLRKVVPLARMDLLLPFPGDATFVNLAASNIGAYTWEFATATGLDCSAGMLFAGLPYGSTSPTHIDPDEIHFSNCGFGPISLSGRVDHDSGTIEGIDIIGDPMWEYGIPGFAPNPAQQP